MENFAQYASLFWKSLLEIGIIWFFIYRILIFIQGTRTVQVVIGIILLMGISALTRFFDLTTINWILTKFFAIGIIAMVIIFQPELRRALARLGQNAHFRTFVRRGGSLDEVVKACVVMSEQKIGALIAIQREIGLRNYVESGVQIDARVNAELIQTIFYPRTILHDGGVVIANERIISCGSLFPLSQNPEINKSFGTRHRAALGLAEETDAVVIVVSEETGALSLAAQGKMTSNLTVNQLRGHLLELFLPDRHEATWKKVIRGIFIEKVK